MARFRKGSVQAKRYMASIRKNIHTNIARSVNVPSAATIAALYSHGDKKKFNKIYNTLRKRDYDYKKRKQR